MTRTKIVATLGPASSTPEVILELIKAGVDVFRLNMSHGTQESHRQTFRMIRKVVSESGLPPVAILGDLCGPKIRVGSLEGGQVELVTDSLVRLVTDEIIGDGSTFQVSYSGLGRGMKPGMAVLLADGMLEMEVLTARPGEVDCRVVKGGLLKEKKGVNFPGMPLDLPSLTEKDESDLVLLLEEQADYIALSFVREPADVTALKDRITASGCATPVVAKIERPEAVKDLWEIVREADCVMVARGDLGVEMPPELVPPIQKRIIRLCHQLRKPVITATQMLESMVWNPRPTRAEVSDVAGAVFDGTDGLMLSEETAAGAYPLLAVSMMDKVAQEAERHLADAQYSSERVTGPMDAVASSACRVAEDLKAKAIICFTRSGGTALLLSKYRPSTVIIAATPDPAVLRRMRLYFGVIPLMVDLRPDTDGMLWEVERASLERGLVKEGDLVVLTLGIPPSQSGTNLMKVHRIGEPFGG